jgi:transposase
VRMVLEWRRERDRTDGGFEEVGQKLGVRSDSVRNWFRRQQIDAGERLGLTTEEHKRILELDRENRELRRAKELAGSTGGRNTEPLLEVRCPCARDCRSPLLSLTPTCEALTSHFPQRPGVDLSCQSILRHHSVGSNPSIGVSSEI